VSKLFSPRKFRSQRLHKSPPKGLRLVQRRLPLGYSGIGAADYGHLTWRVVEAGRRFITRQMRRARVYRRVALTQPITAKSSKSRMGKGKGKFKA
jgi:large subunit ribosomal protein L16